MSNIGSQAANGVLLQVPAAFQDATGSYSSMLTEGKMDLPAHTQRKAQLKITFTKPATAQIGLLLNNDKGCQEISYDNNETHETFSIMKYNPGTGPDPEPEEAIDIDFSNPNDVSQIPGRMTMPLYLQNSDATWENIKNDTDFWNEKGIATKDIDSKIEAIKSVSCGICSLSMIISYMRGSAFTPCDALREGIGNTSGGVARWDITGVCHGYKMSDKITISSLTDDVLQTFINQLVVSKRPILYKAAGNYEHFMVISGYEFEPEKVGTSGYASNPYDLSHFKVMDPYDDIYTDPIEGRCQTLADVQKKNHYPTPLYYKLVVDAN